MAPAQWAGSSQRSLLLRCRDWLDSRRGCWLEPLLPFCVGVERTTFCGRDLQSRWIGFPGWELKRSIGLRRLDCGSEETFCRHSEMSTERPAAVVCDAFFLRCGFQTGRTLTRETSNRLGFGSNRLLDRMR